MKTNVTQRLKESKAKSDKRLFDLGVKRGREWAEESAEADELELLARCELETGSTIVDVADLIDGDLEQMIGELDLLPLHSPSFAEGFVTGALVVFAEHLLPAPEASEEITVVVRYDNSTMEFQFDRQIADALKQYGGSHVESGQCLRTNQRELSSTFPEAFGATVAVHQIRKLNPGIQVEVLS